MGFRYKFMQFMSGRYGYDRLSGFLLISSLVLSFINILFRSVILQLFVYFLIFYTLFRYMSRNLEARRRENYWFVDKVNFFKKKKEFHDQKKADLYHIYKKCPACKAVLRLPRTIGVHNTVCPRCGKKFVVKVKK